MVMLWLEGGQGEVRGACAPPPPQHPKSPHHPEPPPPSPLLGGASSAVRAQCNYLGVWPY